MFYEEGAFQKAATVLLTEATDSCAALRIKYRGESQSCLIQCLATTNDIKSVIGVLGSEAADPNFKIGSVGDGILDVTGLTFGDIEDFVNSLDDYECVVEGARRSNSVDATLLEDTTGVQAKSPEQETGKGAALYLDTSVAKNHGFCVSHRQFGQKDYMGGAIGAGINDEGDAINRLHRLHLVLAGSGTLTLKLYFIRGKEEVYTYTLPITAYDTGAADQTWKFSEEWGAGKPITAPAGCRILVQVVSATTLTAVTPDGMGDIVLPQR